MSCEEAGAERLDPPRAALGGDQGGRVGGTKVGTRRVKSENKKGKNKTSQWAPRQKSRNSKAFKRKCSQIMRLLLQLQFSVALRVVQQSNIHWIATT